MVADPHAALVIFAARFGHGWFDSIDPRCYRLQNHARLGHREHDKSDRGGVLATAWLAVIKRHLHPVDPNHGVLVRSPPAAGQLEGEWTMRHDDRASAPLVTTRLTRRRFVAWLGLAATLPLAAA